MAWREQDLELLNRNLAAAAALDVEAAPNAGERERLELLDGIAAQMRGMMTTGDMQEVAVYLPLLCHLAIPVAPHLDHAYIC